MKKMMANIIPHIKKELKMLFLIMVPLALILSLFFINSEAQYIIRSGTKLFLYGCLWSLIGMYLMRIIAYVVKRVITTQHNVFPDIYLDESKN